MSLLALCLLGAFQLSDGEISLILEQARLPELIAYIALHRRQPISRQSLAFLFWPDSSEAQARTNLRNLLFKLRSAWTRSEDFLAVGRTEIRWKDEHPYSIDVVDFEDVLAASAESANPMQKEADLRRALTLYKGDLLPDLYDDWVLKERERLRGLFLQAQEALLLLLENQRRYEEAIVEAQRLLQADPLREMSHRHLMRLLAAKGDRAAALRAYHACASILEHELGVHPSAATQEIYNRLLNVESAAPAALEALAQTSPLVGRLMEWKELMDAWQAAQQGRSRLVVISGEAGIGKTRLAEELVDRATHQGYSVASSRAYAAEGALSYAPVSEWLRRKAIRRFVDQVEPIWQVEIARLLPEILHDHPDLPAPGPLREGWQRQRFFEGLARLFLALPQPLLLHLDDLQWCDEETLTFLHYLLRSAHQAQMLIVGTVRSEDVDDGHPLNRILSMLRQDDLLREIELGPLSAAETAALATQTTGNTIPDPIHEDLYRESEGHPLFLIEMIRMRHTERRPQTTNGGQQTGQFASAPSYIPVSAIPPKIQAVIGARLAQLSSQARELAQLAAVVGREFSFTILQAASSADEETLVTALDELWQRRIVREQDEGYDFSHDRIREVAYAEISRVRRRFLHRRVAQALIQIYGENRGDHLRAIAVHWEEAGDNENARIYHSRAGANAMERFAAVEAQEHLLAAIRLTPDEWIEERFALLKQLQEVYAWQSLIPKQAETLTVMEALAERMNDDARRALCAAHRAGMCSRRGRPHERSYKAQEAVALAKQAGAVDILALGYFHWGSALWEVSNFTEAAPLLRKAADLARQAGLPVEEEMALEMSAALGMFTGMSATDIHRSLKRCWELVTQAGNLMRQVTLCNKFGYLPVAQGEGNYGEARHWYERGLKMARDIHDADMQGQILINLVVLDTVDGRYNSGQNDSAAYLALPEGGRDALNHGRYLTYWAGLLTNVGLFPEALAQLEESLNVLNRQGSRHFAVKTLAALSWLRQLMGDHCAGQAAAEEALDIVTTTGDLRYRAVALTYQGYTLHSLGDLDAAASAFQQAHTVHRQMEQHNRSMAPLAGLARIAVDRGETTQAVQMAHEICTHLQSQPLDRTIEACRVHLTAYHTLRAVDDPRADWVLQTAWDQLQRRAATIDDPEWLQRFWQVPEHMAVRAAILSTPFTR